MHYFSLHRSLARVAILLSATLALLGEQTQAALVPGLAVSVLDFAPVEGLPLNNAAVATFTDVSGVPGTYTVTIDWGDNSATSAGMIVSNSFDRFVSQAYLDLLGRAPGTAELTAAIGLADRKAVVTLLLGSSEYRTRAVRLSYQRFLHRDADAAGLAVWANALGAGATMEQFAAALIGSNEYFVNRAGGTNTGFLDALFQDVLARPVDPVGLAAFGQLLSSGTPRGDVALAILKSDEARARLVGDFYMRFLGRAVDASGLSFYTGLLHAGQTQESVIVTIVSSPEYFTHAGAAEGTFTVLGSHTYATAGGVRALVTASKAGLGSANGTRSITVADAPLTPFGRTINRHALFVARLAEDILGHPIDPLDLDALLPAVQHAGRKAGAAALHGTLDYSQKLLGDLFMRFLGRTPSEQDFGLLLPAVHNGTERVVARILSSSEYFNRVGGTRNKFIQGLYSDLLNRPATQGEIDAFIGLLRTGTEAKEAAARLQVALKVLQRRGSRSLVVGGLYQQFLGRQPESDLGELERALTRLKRGRTLESLADSILASQEYFDLALGDFEFANKFDGVIASFRDANPNSKASDFVAMIEWGDGSAPDPGGIVLNRGLFHVTGMHTFANKGSFAVNVQIIGGNQMVNALSRIELSPECPTDVSDSITSVRRDAKFDAATGQTSQKVTLTNTGATPIVGPLYLVVDGLPFTATLVNATGLTQCVEPRARPFLEVILPPPAASAAGGLVLSPGTLQPGQRVTRTLLFANPLNRSVKSETHFFAGAGAP
jgi:hypothetical protein